jgi:hypothetical protein
MRVLIDTTYAQRAPHSGTAVYLDRLIEALGHESGIELVTEHHERRRPPAGGGLRSVRNLLSDRGWTEFELPRRARDSRADVIHHPLAARARRADVAQVVSRSNGCRSCSMSASGVTRTTRIAPRRGPPAR